jgi:hypothetical protein
VLALMMLFSTVFPKASPLIEIPSPVFSRAAFPVTSVPIMLLATTFLVVCCAKMLMPPLTLPEIRLPFVASLGSPIWLPGTLVRSGGKVYAGAAWVVTLMPYPVFGCATIPVLSVPM